MKKLTLKMFSLAILAWAPLAGAALTPVDLRCDYAVNPLGVDSPNPRLFWKLESSGRNQQQSAYQVLVAASAKTLAQNRGDLWDSGKVASDATIQIPCPGEKLKSSQLVFWKVRVWDAEGKVSAWSKPATWTEGLLHESDWQAKWIGAADPNIASLLLRREFSVKPGLQRALIHVCGLGQYELTLNGKKIGDDFLSPGWSKYDRTCLYDTRDLTAELRRGTNAVGLELGNGIYNIPAGERYTKFVGSFGPQKAIAQIRLEYADGSVENIGTDENWRVTAGPITFSSIYGGEDFDARRVQRGWDKINFNDSRWAPAKVVSGPGGKLRGLSCAAPPIRRFEIHQAVETGALTNGDRVFDLGQNASHVPVISVTGPAGSRVQLIPAELTNRDGSVSQASMNVHRNAMRCEFIKATDGEETWSPKFFYVGCRFIQVRLLPAAAGVSPDAAWDRPQPAVSTLPKVVSLAGRVVNSASEPAGEFECSNPLFNRIRTLVRWAQRSNMVSLMTDCPHRERLGWLEQDHLNGPALRYEFDLAQLFAKTLNDIADSQLTNGLVPTIAPEYTAFFNRQPDGHLRGMFGDSPEWGSSFILVPWQQYEFDGDLELFRTHYDAMKHYLEYFGTRADHFIVNYGLGDWYDIGPRRPGVSQLTPIALTATAFYYQDSAILARVAALLGQDENARQFSALARNIRAAFNEKFYNATNRCYATDSQCANAIPLVMGLCEPTNRAAVVDAIVRDVRARHNGLTAGDVGYRYLLRALADGGRSDVIYDLNNQSDQPGYGMQIKKGATSLTEAWDAGTGSSQNHFMLGQIEEWFYHDLAGIHSGSNGFKKIILAPQPVGDLTWVKARYQSIRGPIVSEWRLDGGTFTLKTSIPCNTTAEVWLPAQSAGTTTAAGATFRRMENGCAVFAIGSGDYTFESRF